MKVITLTLNPAFDTYCEGEPLIPGSENFAEITVKCAGGKGLNISRALSSFAVKNIAFMLLGDGNGQEFEALVKKEGIEAVSLYAGGMVRENITHRGASVETRLSFPGFTLGKEEFFLAESRILALIEPGDTVTLAGSLPKGVSAAMAHSLAEKIIKAGARLVIDSRSLGLSDVISASPYLIKPNLLEISSLTGKTVTTREQAAEEAERIFVAGVENVMVSLGAEGAVLACSEGVYYAKAPSVAVKSTVGAGDSMIAGFIYAESLGLSKKCALEYAVAFGSAACIKEGTSAVEKEAVERLVKGVFAENI